MQNLYNVIGAVHKIEDTLGPGLDGKVDVGNTPGVEKRHKCRLIIYQDTWKNIMQPEFDPRITCKNFPDERDNIRPDIPAVAATVISQENELIDIISDPFPDIRDNFMDRAALHLAFGMLDVAIRASIHTALRNQHIVQPGVKAGLIWHKNMLIDTMDLNILNGNVVIKAVIYLLNRFGRDLEDILPCLNPCKAPKQNDFLDMIAAQGHLQSGTYQIPLAGYDAAAVDEHNIRQTNVIGDNVVVLSQELKDLADIQGAEFTR
jgi:hypothetical protein